MASKANKDLLKHLKSRPKPGLGSIEYDLMLQSNLSVNNPISQDSPTIIILCGPSGSGKSTIKSSLLSQYKISDYIKVKNLFKRGFLREDIFQNLSFFSKYQIVGDDRQIMSHLKFIKTHLLTG